MSPAEADRSAAALPRIPVPLEVNKGRHIVELEPRVRVARAGVRADAEGEDPYEELPEGVPAEPLVPDEVSVTIVGRPKKNCIPGPSTPSAWT